MSEDRTILLTFVWTLVTAKVSTSVLILWFFPSLHALIIVLALSVPWLVTGAYYGGRRSRSRLRLVRARRRRRDLIQGEWIAD